MKRTQAQAKTARMIHGYNMHERRERQLEQVATHTTVRLTGRDLAALSDKEGKFHDGLRRVSMYLAGLPLIRGVNRFNWFGRTNDKAQTSLRRTYRDSEAGVRTRLAADEEYGATVRAQKGFTTKELTTLRAEWIKNRSTVESWPVFLTNERKRLEKNARSRASKARARALKQAEATA